MSWSILQSTSIVSLHKKHRIRVMLTLTFISVIIILEELLLELARKENEFKELADEKLSRLVPIKNRPEYKVAQEALQRSRFSSSSSSFSSEDNKVLPTLPKEDNKENKNLTWLINRGEVLQQSFRDDTNASIRAMRRRTTTYLDTLYEEAKGALHEKQKVDDVGTDKMLTAFHKVYTNRMLSKT